MSSRRSFLGGAAALGAWPLLAGAQAPYPSRPITLWNRSGAGGTMVMPILQQAEPDGYTIAQLPQPIFRLVHTQKVLWDPIRDVTPILQVSGVTFGVLVNASSRFRKLDDLFTYARENPGRLSIATNGVGTTPHVVLEELFTARGLTYIHVPYKGTSEQLIAVESGQVMAGVNSTGFGPAVDSGQLRLLVIFSARRSRRWSSVPTLRELGHDIVATSPYGLGGPRGLPAEVVTVLHDAFKKAMFEPQFIQELAKYDQEIDYLGTAEYAEVCRQQFIKEGIIVNRIGLSRGG